MLFRPKELQKYEFYGKDKTQIYWLHFTGSDVKNTLLFNSIIGCFTGTYTNIFSHIHTPDSSNPVSYTHLDVYKRQVLFRCLYPLKVTIQRIQTAKQNRHMKQLRGNMVQQLLWMIALTTQYQIIL